MKFHSARRLVPACVISAAAVAALAAPGMASAEVAEQCSGVNVTGQGSSLQKLAQQNVWNPDFNTSTAKAACSGKQGSKDKPAVAYTSTGSGAGLKSWGAEPTSGNPFVGFSSTNAYLGTDEPPNAAQKAEIEAKATGGSDTLQTIPVLQGAVAVIVHLPAGCTATSKAFAGRLVLGNATLEGIYRGTISKWSQITEDGDTLEGGSCNSGETIKRVVRLDQSGTTHIFKKYLDLINGSKFEDEEGNEVTWTQSSRRSQHRLAEGRRCDSTQLHRWWGAGVEGGIGSQQHRLRQPRGRACQQHVHSADRRSQNGHLLGARGKRARQRQRSREIRRPVERSGHRQSG